MKLKTALASASLLVLSACGTSPEALQALQSMQILENNAGEGISYQTLSGSGNDVTLRGVSIKAPAGLAAMMAEGDEPAGLSATPAPQGAAPTVIARAETMTLKGLTMKAGKPVARDIVVSKVTPAVPMGEATLSIGSFGFEGMNEATGAFIASAFTKDGPGAPPAFEQWSFAKASINGVGVSAKIPAEEGQAVGAVNVQLGELSFSNLSNRVLGLARLSGVKGDLDIPGMPAIKGAFDLGTFDIEKLRAGMFADVVGAVMAMQMDGDAPDMSKALAGYTSPLEAGYDLVRWSGANADVSGLKFATTPIEAKVTRNADGVAIAMTQPHFAMTFTADSSGGTLGAMGMMGLAMVGFPSNSVEIYGEASATFDPAKDLTRWTNYNVGVTDLFDIKASGGVLGVQQAMPTLISGVLNVLQAAEKAEMSADEPAEDADEEAEGEDDGEDADSPADEPEKAVTDAMQSPEVMQAAMQMLFGLMSLQLTDLDVSITDKKLVELILTQSAMESGQSVAATRQDLANMVSGSAELMTGVGVDAAIANEATAAIAGFLSAPGTLRIQLKPAKPIGAMNLMMSPTKESLGFSATFTPAAK